MLASRFPAVRFQRVNPSNLSGKSAEWSPNPVLWNDAKVGRMLDELLAFDVTIMKPNCYTPGDKETHVHQRWRSWLCERHHSGQRLVHALAAGLPSVVWGASQGFVDAVGPSEVWPTAWNNSEVLHHLEELLSNGTLRCSLSAEARRLAEPYHISKTVERYALAFAALLEAFRLRLSLSLSLSLRLSLGLSLNLSLSLSLNLSLYALGAFWDCQAPHSSQMPKKDVVHHHVQPNTVVDPILHEGRRPAVYNPDNHELSQKQNRQLTALGGEDTHDTAGVVEVTMKRKNKMKSKDREGKTSTSFMGQVHRNPISGK
ncbi:unnamed protein product, partial [Polarella glacialis]